MNSTTLSATVPWEPVEGIPTDARIHAMASGHDDQRVIVYVNYTGGFGTLPTATGHEPSMNSGRTGPSAGIFRLTTPLPTECVYLPFVSRDSVPWKMLVREAGGLVLVPADAHPYASNNRAVPAKLSVIQAYRARSGGWAQPSQAVGWQTIQLNRRPK